MKLKDAITFVLAIYGVAVIIGTIFRDSWVPWIP